MAARWRVALLVLATTLVWVAQYDRWTLASWSVPTDYRGDSFEILARIQAAAEGNTVPLRPQVITRLGAPFGANWSAYPSSDLLLLWSLGRLARVVGVFAAANLALLAAAVSAAVSFYGCARWLRARWEWAFAGALLFAFTFQTFNRGLAHLFVVYSWTVPVALLSCGLIAASRRIQPLGLGGLFCVATAAAIGVGNPYTLFLYLQLVGWAVLAQWIGPRRRENLTIGLAAIVVALTGFIAAECHVWFFTSDTGAASPIVRNYGGTERYALKPIELLLPSPDHRWGALGFFGERYVRWSDWRTGEAFAPYLGIVGIVALGWLTVATFRAVLRGRRLPGLALSVGWIMAFASVGGITNILAFFTNVTVFRATNRYSIFISAVVLLFFVLQMSRWARLKPAWASVAAAFALLTFGLADQLPRPIARARRERIAQQVASDLDLGARLQKEIPQGGMVFQLPVLGFPEIVPPHQLSDYEYFRPYLGAPSLKFTYGALKGRSRGRWQRETAELPPAEMVRQLESYGFSAIYLNRRGFADRGEKLLSELAAAGRDRRIESRLGEQVVVLLNPSAQPLIPVAHSLTFGRGWHEQRPGEPHWAYGPATLSFYNPQARPLRSTLRFVLSAAGLRHVRIRLNGGEPVSCTIDTAEQVVQVPVMLPPGFSRIDLESVEPPERLSSERDQLKAFAVHEAHVELAAVTAAM